MIEKNTIALFYSAPVIQAGVSITEKHHSEKSAGWCKKCISFRQAGFRLTGLLGLLKKINQPTCNFPGSYSPLRRTRLGKKLL